MVRKNFIKESSYPCPDMGAANHIIRAEMATIIAENTYDKTGRLRSCYELAKFSGVTSSTALHYRDGENH